MTDAMTEFKRAAAERAVALIEDGMVVGLGTGTTAAYAVAALGRRVRQGLAIVGIPTSERTAAQAREEGIPLGDLEAFDGVDLTIDGADEITRDGLDLIKGLGGALLREKVVAAASRRLVIIADESKLVDRLGERAPVPVEVTPFAVAPARRGLEAMGALVTLRLGADGAPLTTDGGNHILDARLAPLDEPRITERRIKLMTGVVDSGLFIGMADQAYVAGPGGVIVMTSGR